MHIRLLIIFVIIFPELLFAQSSQLQIAGKPERSETEIVAVVDANGRFCAAIQVISDMEGFSYDSNNGVVKVDDMPGSDLVYLSPDERVLQIYHSGYEPLKIILSEEGIQLHEREVWSLKVKGEQASNLISVTIFAEPPDAVIEIDKESTAGGPVFLLSKGEHSIKVSKLGYNTLVQTIMVDEKNAFFRPVLKPPTDVSLQITSVPDGALVYLDSLKIGITPVAVFFPEGSYRIKIEKQGYLTVEEPFVVSLPAVTKTFTLEENVGLITINTDSRAKLYINDELIAQRTNIKIIPGVVRLRVTLIKAPPLEKQIILKRNDKVTLDLFPAVPSGTIQVSVVPFDARVELHGDAEEFYTAIGNKIFENIPFGTYQIKLSKEGYEYLQESLELKANEKISKSYKLVETKEPKQILINIKTNPQGASVYLDDMSKGIIEQLQVTPGNHRIELVKSGYEKVNNNIFVDEKNTVFQFTLTPFPLKNFSEIDKRISEINAEIEKNSELETEAVIFSMGLLGWTEYDLLKNYDKISKKRKNWDWAGFVFSSIALVGHEIICSENSKLNQEKNYLLIKKKGLYVSKEQIQRSGHSRAEVFLLSALFPGLGQVTHGRNSGIWYLGGMLTTNMVYVYQLSEHDKNIDNFNRLYSAYRNETTSTNRNAALQAYEKARQSYKKCNQVLYVAGGIYALNLLDALIFNPGPSNKNYSLIPYIGPSFADLNASHNVIGLQVEVKL